MSAPVFLDLVWTPEGDNFTAPATEAWWEVYTPRKTALRALGLRCEPRLAWTVIFEPAKAPATLLDSLAMLQLEFADPIAAAAERERRLVEWRAEQDRLAVEREAKRKAEAEGVRAQGRALQDLWGAFVERKDELENLVSKSELEWTDLKAIKSIIAATDRKAVRFAHSVDTIKLDPVDWPEATVIEAVRLLTGRDRDRASIRNLAGWSAAYSSWGHWCHAMLETDRPLAIKAARRLVSEYADTQLSHLI